MHRIERTIMANPLTKDDDDPVRKAFTDRTIEIKASNGRIEKTPALCYRDFGVNNGRLGYRITHLPSGAAFPWYFKQEIAALHSAVEIDRLRNNWSHLEGEDVNEKLAQQINRIVGRYGGELKPPSTPADPRAALNNYSEEEP